MKHALLSVIAFSVASFAGAQITLTQNDVAPLYTQILQANDTMPTVLPGSPGTSQTYDVSATNNHYLDTLLFTLPQFTPYGSSFTSSNLAMYNSQNGTPGYIYLTNNSSVYQVDGTAADPLGTGTIAIPLSNPEELMAWPSTFNTSFIDTAKGMFQMYYGQDPGIGFTVDSFRVHIWVKKTSDIDGWGSCITPAATYNNVLRQNVLRVEYDTIDIYAFGNWAPDFYQQLDSNRIYSYWANGAGFPVAQLTDRQDLGTITSANYILSTAQVGIAEHHNGNVNVYPNPANDVINFSLSGMHAAGITVYDVNGKLVTSLPVNSDHTSLDVSAFNAGIYFYNVTDANGNSISRSRFTVTH
ncbi:MAG: T9SS type A sorting domain-containing protein [Bacteroidetes bacterium]|nr:T9SS type A sorting domain-containing protein [Bacteroidota bacterium]